MFYFANVYVFLKNYLRKVKLFTFIHLIIVYSLLFAEITLII